MTLTDGTPPATRPAVGRRAAAYVPAAAGLLLAAAASVASLRLAGPGHGALFGACVAVALLVPPLTAAAAYRSAGHAAAVAAATGLGALLGPTLALAAGDLNNPTFLPAAAVVLTLSAAAAGMTLLLLAARVNRSAAAWTAVLLILLWLSWPVWLGQRIAGREDVVGWLSPANPLLAIDSALVRQGITPWTEHRLMYGRLTVLGQHVLARPPTGPGPAVLLHLAAAAPGFAVAGVLPLQRFRRWCGGSRPDEPRP